MKINRTTRRVTQILKLLSEASDGLTMTEISERLGVPKTSVYYIVQTLQLDSFVYKFNRRYYIGFMVNEIGETYSQDKCLYGTAGPVVEKLSRESNMTASLVVMRSNYYLDYIFTSRPQMSIAAHTESFDLTTLHASATGKVFLAFMPESRKNKIIQKMFFKKYTEKTITSKTDYLQEIEKVHNQGFALDDREYDNILICASVPIFHEGKIIAALTISGLNINKTEIMDFIPILKNHSATISERLLSQQ